MSKQVRVALVVEGPTDALAIEYALTSLWGSDVSIVCTTIQPETAAPNIFHTGIQYENPGWCGIYKWCKNLSKTGIARDIFTVAELQHDLLIIQIDADVAKKSYGDCSLPQDATAPLPLGEKTYIAQAQKLENHIKNWLDPVSIGNTTVLCIPAYTLETWVYIGKNAHLPLRTSHCPVEERTDLVGRIPKKPRKYLQLRETLIKNWQHIEVHCSQAKKFSDAIRAFPL